MHKYVVYFEYIGKMQEAIIECWNEDEAEDIFREEFGFDGVYIDQICRVDCD